MTDVSGIIIRLQEAFEPEDMTESRLKEWFYHGERGKHLVSKGLNEKQETIFREVKGEPLNPKTIALAKRFSETSRLYEKLKEARSLNKLKEIRNKAKLLDVHSKTIIGKIDFKINEREIRNKEKKIARSITLSNNFANERGIELSDKFVGGVYTKWGSGHKKAVVIFNKTKGSKIKTWKYI